MLSCSQHPHLSDEDYTCAGFIRLRSQCPHTHTYTQPLLCGSSAQLNTSVVGHFDVWIGHRVQEGVLVSRRSANARKYHDERKQHEQRQDEQDSSALQSSVLILVPPLEVRVRPARHYGATVSSLSNLHSMCTVFIHNIKCVHSIGTVSYMTQRSHFIGTVFTHDIRARFSYMTYNISTFHRHGFHT